MRSFLFLGLITRILLDNITNIYGLLINMTCIDMVCLIKQAILNLNNNRQLYINYCR